MFKHVFSEKRATSGWVKRQILETIDNFEDAVEAMSTRPYAATEYNIISGVKKGVILARNPDGLVYSIPLKDTDRYIIMTNFDSIYHDIKVAAACYSESCFVLVRAVVAAVLPDSCCSTCCACAAKYCRAAPVVVYHCCCAHSAGG